MSENEGAISEFCDITGATPQEGKFFLESAAWVMEDALGAYYESPDEPPLQPEPMVGTEPDNNKQPPPKPLNVKPRFGTLSNIRKDSSSDEEEGQRFYAGGSVHSGQEVVGPGRPHADVISDMFKSVRDLGGIEAAGTSSNVSGQSITFRGTGYRLGQTPDDTEVVNDSSSRSEKQRREVTLRLWRNGFSVDDGHLRSYASPQDKEFLNKIRSGQVPEELLHDVVDESIHLNMEDHRHEVFVPPKAAPKPFTGAGYILGSLTPNVTTEATENLIPSPPPSTPQHIAVDTEQPTTTVQIRLTDGTRLQAILNHTHTIADLRNYLISNRPELNGSRFSLLTTFPSKELNDDGLTLAEAGILNTSVLLRMK